MRIGFIGAGQMATALAKGMTMSKGIPPCNEMQQSAGMVTSNSDVTFVVRDPSKNAVDAFCMSLDRHEVMQCETSEELVSSSDVILVAVKPQYIDAALNGLNGVKNEGKVFVSVVAGVTIEGLRQRLGSTQIIRTMPNTPCLIGEGAIAMAAHEFVTESSRQQIRELLSGVGSVVDVSESQLNAVTGLSGSGPAYVYTFIESLIDAGVCSGLPRNIARELAVQTVLGATQMVVESGEHPAVLRDKVTSPGGTTISGMAALEQGGFRAILFSAVQSATRRAGELGSE